MISETLRSVLLSRLDGIKRSTNGYMARCPAHEDRNPSLSISPGQRQPVVINCLAGCDPTEVLARLDLTWADLSNPRDRGPRLNDEDDWILCGWSPGKPYDRRHRKVAEYVYRDTAGHVVFAVARCALKGNGCGFRQWRPDPLSRAGKKWSRRLPDGTKVGEGLPYRLPELIAANPAFNVLVVEGEKDANRAWALGVPATCNAEGSGKWTPGHARWLAERDVIVVADRDQPGWNHAGHVANTLLDVARSVEVVRARTGKDLSDHLDAGHSLADLVSVAQPKPEPRLGPDGQDAERASA